MADHATVKSMEFDDDEDLAFVTVRLPIEVAIYLGMLTGKQNGLTSEEVAPGFGRNANHQAYELFSGGIANRFWDGGLEDAAQHMREK